MSVIDIFKKQEYDAKIKLLRSCLENEENGKVCLMYDTGTMNYDGHEYFLEHEPLSLCVIADGEHIEFPIQDLITGERLFGKQGTLSDIINEVQYSTEYPEFDEIQELAPIETINKLLREREMYDDDSEYVGLDVYNELVDNELIQPQNFVPINDRYIVNVKNYKVMADLLERTEDINRITKESTKDFVRTFAMRKSEKSLLGERYIMDEYISSVGKYLADKKNLKVDKNELKKLLLIDKEDGIYVSGLTIDGDKITCQFMKDGQYYNHDFDESVNIHNTERQLTTLIDKEQEKTGTRTSSFAQKYADADKHPKKSRKLTTQTKKPNTQNIEVQHI